MLTTTERMEMLTDIFNQLQSTNSTNEKRDIVNDIPEELKDDFTAIVECLNGQYIFGYTLSRTYAFDIGNDLSKYRTIRWILNVLSLPRVQGDLSNNNIMSMIDISIKDTYEYNFMAPIVNKELRLGIGRSLLGMPDIAPMLANKFEDKFDKLCGGFIVTQKLDGNRCIAVYNYDKNKWEFFSRNGKSMYVDFDMTGFPTQYIYDGEILSASQTEDSKRLYYNLSHSIKSFANESSTDKFQSTSGLIHRHTLTGKDLVYNIFDIQTYDAYADRRRILNSLHDTDNVRILPTITSLAITEHNKTFIEDSLYELLDDVTSMGAEGLMLNRTTAKYQYKRTNDLLKFKKLKTMDMIVYDYELGQGKYEGCIGALLCKSYEVDKNNHVNCYIAKVGTGLSDYQRHKWVTDWNTINGGVIEVGYFDVSQNKNIRETNQYSLRFPRLLRVRTDKEAKDIGI